MKALFLKEKYSRGRRGAPAKGIGRETGARVRIPLSPLGRGSHVWLPFFLLFLINIFFLVYNYIKRLFIFINFNGFIMKKIKHFIKSGLIALSCGVVSLGVTSGVGIIGTYAGELQSDNDNVSTEEKNISKIELNELQTSSDLSLLVMDSGWYQIVSAADSNLALEVKDGANVNGANVYVNKRSDSNSQKFFINNLKPGRNEYAIKTAVSNTEKALDVSGGSPARGVNVGQWHYHGGNAVRWKLYKSDDDKYVMVSSTGDRVLDITGARTTAGTNVWTWDYYGANTQKWNLTKDRRWVDGKGHWENTTK